MTESISRELDGPVDRADGEAGIGLVEILIAMFLLTLLSVSFLPLLISSLQLSVRTSQTNTATQILNEQLDLLTATAPTCAALTAFGSAAVPDVVDERGVVYEVDRGTPSCSGATFPDVFSVEFSVEIDDGSGRELTADSAFLVTAAG